MPNEIKNMLKKVILNILLISIVFSAIIYFINKQYILAFVIGSLMAIVSFTINTVLTTRALGKNKNKLVFFLSSILRILLVCIVGAVLAKININYILPYILGYSTEVLSMIFYGVSLKKQI